MDIDTLRAWAGTAGSAVEAGADQQLSITSKLVRFEWRGAPAVGVAGDVDGNTRISSLLDAVMWWSARHPRADTLHLLIDRSPGSRATDEHVHALGTLAGGLLDGPRIVLSALVDGEVDELDVAPARFTGEAAAKTGEWARLLEVAQAREPVGLAADLVGEIGHPAAALYPRLTDQEVGELWQVRLDGLEIGRVGASTGRLALATKGSFLGSLASEPHAVWNRVIGAEPVPFSRAALAGTVALVRRLIEAWSVPGVAGAVLRHGQPEHALEAHVLSGRAVLESATAGRLRPAAPSGAGVLRTAQVPTLWGDVGGPPRHLDALLADDDGRPWVIELKDPGDRRNGAYLRAGIGQAVLARHYLRTVGALDGWFGADGLDLRREECQAALAFPVTPGSGGGVARRHAELARRWGVEVIAFARPGS